MRGLEAKTAKVVVCDPAANKTGQKNLRSAACAFPINVQFETVYQQRGGVKFCSSATRAQTFVIKTPIPQLFDKINARACERQRPANDVKSQTRKVRVRERISSARNYLLQSSTRLCTAINIQAAGQTFVRDRE